jgi:hypothetical protein
MSSTRSGKGTGNWAFVLRGAVVMWLMPLMMQPEVLKVEPEILEVGPGLLEVKPDFLKVEPGLLAMHHRSSSQIVEPQSTNCQ